MMHSTVLMYYFHFIVTVLYCFGVYDYIMHLLLLWCLWLYYASFFQVASQETPYVFFQFQIWVIINFNIS